MKFLTAFLIPLLFPLVAAAADFTEYRACVAAATKTTVRDSFQHCVGPLAAECGAAKTAQEAVTCIDSKRFEMEDEITREYDRLAAADPEAKENLDILVSNAREGGLSACETMGLADEATGVKVGQRAVNTAFCLLVASGDVLGVLIGLEPE